jgi:hypothetical protein
MFGTIVTASRLKRQPQKTPVRVSGMVMMPAKPTALRWELRRTHGDAVGFPVRHDTPVHGEALQV